MRRWRELVIDTWGALAYKPAFQQAAEGRPTRLPGPAAATWVPEEDRRRLAAYVVANSTGVVTLGREMGRRRPVAAAGS